MPRSFWVCAALFLLLVPSAVTVFAHPRRGPAALAFDLRHHRLGQIQTLLAPRVLINDDAGRIIGSALRNDTVHALERAGIARVLKVDLVCVEVRTVHLVHLRRLDERGHRLFRASSRYLDFTFNEYAAIAGLIFAKRRAATNMC